MQKISEPAAGRAGKVLGAPPRIMGRAGVLIGILLLALFQHPVPALGAMGFGQYGVDLNWNHSPSPGVAGYRVYYGTTSGNYSNSVVLGNVTTNTFSGLMGGVTYFFAVTAYDANGLESNFSNESSFAGNSRRADSHRARRTVCPDGVRLDRPHV